MMKNLLKYASLLMAAAVLFSCEGNIDNPKPGPENPTPEQVCDVCGKNPCECETPEPGDLVFSMSVDKKLIQTFDDYATITVTLGDEKLTEGVTFYSGKTPVEIPDFKFSTTEPGQHTLWASYGTYISEEITITAINVAIPETPADPKPGSTEFKARVLASEFTTTGCSYCPNMKNLVHRALADEEVADRLVLTACHSGLINSVKDPAYIRTTYDEFAKCEGFPYMFFEMYYGFNNYNTSVGDFVSLIDQFVDFKQENAAGIAVNSSLVDGQMVAKVTVKAAAEGEYRVGAFLLEDGIYGHQSGSMAEEWMNTHDGVIRYIDSQYHNKAGKEMYYGHSVGNIAKGETADHMFVWDVDAIWDKGALNGELYGGYFWDPFNEEKLHLAIFVCTVGTDDKGNEFWYVNNVIDCPVNGKTPFEYR